MRLRVVYEQWRPLEFRYVVEQNRAITTTQNEWCYVAGHQEQLDAERYAELLMKGPVVLKEYDSNPNLGVAYNPL